MDLQCFSPIIILDVIPMLRSRVTHPRGVCVYLVRVFDVRHDCERFKAKLLANPKTQSQRFTRSPTVDDRRVDI